MSFPRSNQKVPGYDPEQVDALMNRVKTQFENPGFDLLTSKILEVARFELVLGGYQVRAVDEAIAKVCDTLLERELKFEIVSSGRATKALKLQQLLESIRKTMDMGPKAAFSPSKTGYSKRSVSKLFKKINLKRGALSAPSTFDLRTMPLGKSTSGLDRTEVDEFISMLVTATHIQRLL